MLNNENLCIDLSITKLKKTTSKSMFRCKKSKSNLYHGLSTSWHSAILELEKFDILQWKVSRHRRNNITLIRWSLLWALSTPCMRRKEMFVISQKNLSSYKNDHYKDLVWWEDNLINKSCRDHHHYKIPCMMRRQYN